MQITVLCKVVDNFGDIGVCWRMVKQLKIVAPKYDINFVVDDLKSFSKICSDVHSDKDFQIVRNIKVYNWNARDFCYKEFSKNDGEKLSVILENFQCGRPDWMEKILFDDKLAQTVHIIMIDYLSAEKYAQDFHCSKSLTRNAKVQKVNFMPGFTEKTGGLVLGGLWDKSGKSDKSGKTIAKIDKCYHLENQSQNQFQNENWLPKQKKILVFTYKKDWTALAKSLENNFVYVAQGVGRDSFVESWEKVFFQKRRTSASKLCELEFMDQEQWDNFMMSCDILIIRGEDSMSRACLSGIPFIWHAYPQSDEYQIVKVNSLLERMARHFKSEDFKIIQDVWLDFNKPKYEVSDVEFEKKCRNFIENADKLKYGFIDFANDIRKNGDLCANLMTFIEKTVIIEKQI